jgi:hypothetical protein
MESELKKPSRQGISNFFIDIELGASRDNKGGRDFFRVEDALQP